MPYPELNDTYAVEMMYIRMRFYHLSVIVLTFGPSDALRLKA